MLRKILYLTFILPIVLSAQDGEYLFRVVINKGENKIITNGNEDLIEIGSSFYGGQQISMGNEGYLGLVHRSGEVLDVSQSGIISVSDLGIKVEEKRATSSREFGKALGLRVTQRGVKSQSTRGLGDDSSVRVLVPEQAKMSLDTCVISWSLSEGSASANFNVYVKDIFGDTYGEVSTQALKTSLNFSDLEIESNLFVVSVTGDNNLTSKDYTIAKVKAEDATEFHAALGELKAGLSGNSPLDNLILASFFEENGYLIDAITVYESGLDRFPEIRGFYDIFLEFNGLSAK